MVFHLQCQYYLMTMLLIIAHTRRYNPSRSIFELVQPIGAILKSFIRGQCYKTFLRLQFTNFCNKLEWLSLISLSSLVYRLWAMSGAYPRVEHLEGSSIGVGSFLYYQQTIDYAGKAFRENTLAYYENL
jgi:hypothetical protein